MSCLGSLSPLPHRMIRKAPSLFDWSESSEILDGSKIEINSRLIFDLFTATPTCLLLSD